MDLLLILIVILIIVLVWRGPSMLPQFGEALGKAVRGARDNIDRQSADGDAAADGGTAAATEAEPRPNDEHTGAGQ